MSRRREGLTTTISQVHVFVVYGVLLPWAVSCLALSQSVTSLRFISLDLNNDIMAGLHLVALPALAGVVVDLLITRELHMVHKFTRKEKIFIAIMFVAWFTGVSLILSRIWSYYSV